MNIFVIESFDLITFDAIKNVSKLKNSKTKPKLIVDVIVQIFNF